jgi:hypothetical protein
MVNADMCKHEWPGSGCPECRAEAQAAQQEKERAAEEKVAHDTYKAATKALNSMRDATVAAAIGIVQSETEFPGEMPSNVRALLEGKSTEEIMRMAVRATKASITARLQALYSHSNADKISIKVHSS